MQNTILVHLMMLLKVSKPTLKQRSNSSRPPSLYILETPEAFNHDCLLLLIVRQHNI
jgi:hypothetical protein